MTQDDEPLDLHLGLPLRPVSPCGNCGTLVEEGMGHSCSTSRPEAAQ